MPSSTDCAQCALRSRRIERLDDLAVRADALVDLDDALVQEARQLDPAHEQLRTILVTDAQRIREAARDHQRRALALALEQRVGRDGRSHLDRFDGVRPASAHLRRIPGARECPAPPHPDSAPDSRRAACAWSATPSGRRATMSVNVPPRSIQNCQVFTILLGSVAAPRSPGTPRRNVASAIC